jgi:hypothetical protein
MMSESMAHLGVSQQLLDTLQTLADEERTSLDDLLFSMILTYQSEKLKQPERSRALREALDKCWKASIENGTDTMSMEEINAEIAAVRDERQSLAKSA